MVSLEDDRKFHETNVSDDQKDDPESSEVKEKEQVLESSKNSDEHAFSKT